MLCLGINATHLWVVLYIWVYKVHTLGYLSQLPTNPSSKIQHKLWHNKQVSINKNWTSFCKRNSTEAMKAEPKYSQYEVTWLVWTLLLVAGCGIQTAVLLKIEFSVLLLHISWYTVIIILKDHSMLHLKGQQPQTQRMKTMILWTQKMWICTYSSLKKSLIRVNSNTS